MVIKPYKLDISQFGEKVRDRMKFTIENVSEQDLKLTLVDGMTSYAVVDLPDEIEAGKSASGEIRLLEDVLAEDFQKSFTIEVNDQAKSRFTVPVKRTVKSPAGAGESAGAEGKGR